MKELIQKLCASFGPAGREGQIRAVIAAEIEKLKEEYFVDTLGNLVVRKGPAGGKKILVAAHMDEIGLMVTYIEENGYLRFTNLGGIMQQTLPGTRVFFENGTVGVIGQEKTKETREPGLSKYYLDIGAENRETALAKVKIGDAAVYLAPLHQEGKRLTAKSLDNRVGCAVLLETLSRLSAATLPGEVFFVFTVQEEVGLRGAQVAAYRLNPDVALVLETTSCADLPGVPPAKQVTRLGAGPALTFRDRTSIADPQLVRLLIQEAEAAGLPWQWKHGTAGGNDAGAIQTQRGGVRVASLSLPCRYLHQPGNVLSVRDLEHGLELARRGLHAWARELSNGGDRR